MLLNSNIPDPRLLGDTSCKAGPWSDLSDAFNFRHPFCLPCKNWSFELPCLIGDPTCRVGLFCGNLCHCLIDIICSPVVDPLQKWILCIPGAELSLPWLRSPPQIFWVLCKVVPHPENSGLVFVDLCESWLYQLLPNCWPYPALPL